MCSGSPSIVSVIVPPKSVHLILVSRIATFTTQKGHMGASSDLR